MPFGRRNGGEPIVCVSALLIKEIKRVIRESEIMKYVFFFPFLLSPGMDLGLVGGHMLIFFFSLFCSIIGKMTRNGPGRIRMVDKNLRFG